MLNFSRRLGNIAGFLVCAGLMGYAYFAQYVQGYQPCPLCELQRMAMIATGVVFALAAVHDPRGIGRFVYGALVFLTGGAGAAVASRHLWLQSLPPDKVPACGPGLDYMLDTLPFTEVLSKVFTGSGECAQIDWQFLGLSMPGWTLIAFVCLGLGGLWWNVRRGPDATPARRIEPTL